MAKKFVRGITDIKNIEHQDFDTNNVNDLLSDGKHNYIHRKKNDGSEEYHNLTNNLKKLEAVENGLLTVTNYNNTTNSAELEVHHDQAKSQLLGSPNLTINVHNGENGSAELTTVDVNPAKVLVHENLQTSYGISKITSGNTTCLGIEYTKVDDDFDLNYLPKGRIRAGKYTNAPQANTAFLVSAWSDDSNTIQEAISVTTNKVFKRTKQAGTWGEWCEQVGDKSAIDTLLAQKQNTLTNNASIGVIGNTLRQLYALKQNYTHANGYLKTHVKSVSLNTNLDTAEEEFNFLAKMNKGSSSATFTLNEHDRIVFDFLIDLYGEDGSLNISGFAFSLSGSTLTLNCNSANYNPYVVSFTDIIPSNPSQQNVTNSNSKVQLEQDTTVEVEKEIVDSKQSK